MECSNKIDLLINCCTMLHFDYSICEDYMNWQKTFKQLHIIEYNHRGMDINYDEENNTIDSNLHVYKNQFNKLQPHDTLSLDIEFEVGNVLENEQKISERYKCTKNHQTLVINNERYVIKTDLNTFLNDKISFNFSNKYFVNGGTKIVSESIHGLDCEKYVVCVLVTKFKITCILSKDFYGNSNVNSKCNNTIHYNFKVKIEIKENLEDALDYLLRNCVNTLFLTNNSVNFNILTKNCVGNNNIYEMSCRVESCNIFTHQSINTMRIDGLIDPQFFDLTLPNITRIIIDGCIMNNDHLIKFLNNNIQVDTLEMKCGNALHNILINNDHIRTVFIYIIDGDLLGDLIHYSKSIVNLHVCHISKYTGTVISKPISSSIEYLNIDSITFNEHEMTFVLNSNIKETNVSLTTTSNELDNLISKFSNNLLLAKAINILDHPYVINQLCKNNTLSNLCSTKD